MLIFICVSTPYLEDFAMSFVSSRQLHTVMLISKPLDKPSVYKLLR